MNANTTAIEYRDTVEGVEAHHLRGFFVDWPKAPSAETHLRMLQGSDYVVLAMQGERVVAFITAITDRVSCAYIPHLEVLPEFKGKGIGSELVRRMADKLRDLYMVDLLCDGSLLRFYERLGFRPQHAMAIRNYERQACD